MDTIEVKDHPDRSRWVALVDGEEAGFAQYIRRGGRLLFVHTVVDPAFEGRGVGSALARGALEGARAAGDPVVPLCPFIAAYIEKHPEYSDLVDTEALARFDR
jgi:predicted GNAT family acetyltransferase